MTATTSRTSAQSTPIETARAVLGQYPQKLRLQVS